MQLKPLKWVKVTKGDTEEERPIEALMVLKYGGVLTHAGRKQVITFTRFMLYMWILSLDRIFGDCYSHKWYNCTAVTFLFYFNLSFALFLMYCQAEELGRYFRNNMYPGIFHFLVLSSL